MKRRGKRDLRSTIFQKKNHRGLSTVVITLIIILISLVAVGIIWVVVRNVIQTGTEQIDLGKFTVDLSIKNAYIKSGNISVDVQRNAGQREISKIKFILFDGQNSEVVTQNSDLEELESRIFSVHPNDLNASLIMKVSIAPVFKAADGTETLGGVVDTYNLRTGESENQDGGTGGGSVCGNGVIETGESCDLTNFQNLTCASFGFTGGGTLVCDSCQVGTIQCLGGTGGTCGNGIINTGEQCDATNFGGLSCTSFGFAGGGNLSCISCNISTFGCVSQGCIPDCTNRVCGPDPVCGLSCGPCNSPSSCSNGVCVPPACVPNSNSTTCGTAVCGTKVNNCGTLVNCGPLNGACPSGQLCESWSCITPVPVNTGFVQETWPGTSGLFFGSSSLSTTVNYQGYYIKFPSKPTINCGVILHYKFPIVGYNKSYVELAFETPIVSGDSYQIFETSAKCSPP